MLMSAVTGPVVTGGLIVATVIAILLIFVMMGVVFHSVVSAGFFFFSEYGISGAIPYVIVNFVVLFIGKLYLEWLVNLANQWVSIFN